MEDVKLTGNNPGVAAGGAILTRPEHSYSSANTVTTIDISLKPAKSGSLITGAELFPAPEPTPLHVDLRVKLTEQSPPIYNSIGGVQKLAWKAGDSIFLPQGTLVKYSSDNTCVMVVEENVRPLCDSFLSIVEGEERFVSTKGLRAEGTPIPPGSIFYLIPDPLEASNQKEAAA